MITESFCAFQKCLEITTDLSNICDKVAAWSQLLLHFTVTTVSSPLKYSLNVAGVLRKALLCVWGLSRPDGTGWLRLSELGGGQLLARSTNLAI